MKHRFDPTIIREYDIRGIFNETFSEKDALAFGKLFSTLLDGNKIVNVGFDGRKSSNLIKDALCKGLVEGGSHVNIVGLGPTPMLYFSCYTNSAEAGIMITGSHNPSNHNGLKIVKDNRPFFGEDLKEIALMGLDFSMSENSKGSLNSIDIQDKYLNNLLNSLKQKKKLNIVWDAGNGSAGQVMSKLSKKIDGEKILLFDKIDGNFPNHHPDPSEEKNLIDIKKTILKKKYDLGIAFDGDGDRIGVVDDKGRTIPGDILLLIYAKEILKRDSKATVIGDVKCSQILFDTINQLGGNSVMSKTGHSLIKNAMKKFSASLAGEMSGHMFFADEYFGFDDALYAAIRIVNIVSSSEKKLSQLVDEIPKLYNTPEIRIDCDDREKFRVVEKIISNQKDKEMNNIDGVRVSLKNGWWLIRASNTQPAIVLRCEANSQENLNFILEDVKQELNKIDTKLSLQI